MLRSRRRRHQPAQNCEIRTKEEHSIPGETPGAKAVNQKQVRSDEPKHEHRERRPGGGPRSTAPGHQRVALTCRPTRLTGRASQRQA
jgi:hypothetical protein